MNLHKALRRLTATSRTIRLALLAALLVSVATVSHVSGDNFPGTNGNDGTDGRAVTACWNDTGSVPAELNAHLSYFASSIATMTNLVMTMGGCDGTTDLEYDDNLTTSNLFGLRTCLKSGGSFGWTASTSDIECDQSSVQINPTLIATCGLNNALARQFNWCHESGHALGLGHETQCLITGCSTNVVYSAHHITHLATY